jgi:hypothetical protein
LIQEADRIVQNPGIHFVFVSKLIISPKGSLDAIELFAGKDKWGPVVISTENREDAADRCDFMVTNRSDILKLVKGRGGPKAGVYAWKARDSVVWKQAANSGFNEIKHALLFKDVLSCRSS